jgi:hypothetical protein
MSILPLEVVVQIFLSTQQSCSPSQEMITAVHGLQFQDEEAQAEHGSHLFQFTGTKL